MITRQSLRCLEQGRKMNKPRIEKDREVVLNVTTGNCSLNTGLTVEITSITKQGKLLEMPNPKAE